MSQVFYHISIENDEKNQKIFIAIDNGVISIWKYSDLSAWSDKFFDFVLSVIKEKVYLILEKYKAELV
jgi:hypothetical protein